MHEMDPETALEFYKSLRAKRPGTVKVTLLVADEEGVTAFANSYATPRLMQTVRGFGMVLDRLSMTWWDEVGPLPDHTLDLKED